MTIVIHHNPDCRTSRNTLELIRAADEEPTIVEYLVSGWTRPYLQSLFAAAGLTPRTALRTSKSPAEELGLLDETISDDVLLDAMIENPVLVNRPIVCTPRGVGLCRPSERMLNLLEPDAVDNFVKEDGEIVGTSNG